MPVLGRRDLWGIGFVTTDEPPELPARLCRSSDRQQEMPNHRHPVRAKDDPLDVREVELGLVLVPRNALSRCGFIDRSTAQPAKEARPGWAGGAFVPRHTDLRINLDL